jgi:HAMP domain-containing protein
MTFYLLLALWLATTAGLAAALWVSHRRGSRARRELAQTIHDRTLALDRRFDVTQTEIERLDQQQRIDHLLDLVTAGERDGCLTGEVSRRLRRYALRLRAESAAGEIL